MIVSGNPVRSEKAAPGLIDEIIEGDLLAGALAFAREDCRRKAAAAEPARSRSASTPTMRSWQVARKVAKESRGFPAPMKCLECVEASVRLPFEEGLKFERARFDELVNTTESKALRHAFFGERQVSKIPDVPEDTKTIEVKSLAILGAGTMGGGIAMAFANAGIPVKLLETKQEALDRGLATIRKNYDGTVSRGRCPRRRWTSAWRSFRRRFPTTTSAAPTW